MKGMICFAMVSLFSTMVNAGTLTLKSGESATINANSSTTVACDALETVRTIEYKFCECYAVILNDRPIVQALMKAKYSGFSRHQTSVMREFSNGFASDGIGQCEAFVRTVSSCSN